MSNNIKPKCNSETNSKTVLEVIQYEFSKESPEKRKDYFLNVIRYSLTQSRAQTFDEDRINSFILALERGNKKYPYLKYSVMHENGKKILIAKRKDKLKEPIIQILPMKELMNVISDAFLIYPQIDFNELIRILHTRCQLPILQHREYLSVLKTHSYMSSMQCGLISIGENSDNNFNFVLICIDSSNNYAYLRPLMTQNHNEIAIELLKLLLDVGIPSQIEVNVVNLFISVFKYMSVTFNFISPPEIIYKKQVRKLIFCGKKLLKEMKIWLDNTKSNNWVVGLNYVQWLINNKKYDNKIFQPNLLKMSPYQAQFGGRPKLSSIVSEPEDFQDICIYNESICVICNTITFKAIICDDCNRPVHSMCASKTLVPDKYVNIIKVTCTMCTNSK